MSEKHISSKFPIDSALSGLLKQMDRDKVRRKKTKQRKYVKSYRKSNNVKRMNNKYVSKIRSKSKKSKRNTKTGRPQVKPVMHNKILRSAILKTKINY